MMRKGKSPACRSHEYATVRSFRSDPAFAAAYLNAVLEEGDQAELMLAMRRINAMGMRLAVVPAGKAPASRRAT